MERHGRAFFELGLGDVLEEAMTITEAHVVQTAVLCNDYNVLHTDAPRMQHSRFGQRIVHAALINGLMIGVYSKVFYDTDISTVEFSASYTAPVYIDDTITMRWTVEALDPKPKLDGGLVELAGEVIKPDGTVTSKMSAKLLVGNKTIFEWAQS